MAASLKELKKRIQLSPSSQLPQGDTKDEMANTTRPRMFMPSTRPVGTFGQEQMGSGGAAFSQPAQGLNVLSTAGTQQRQDHSPGPFLQRLIVQVQGPPREGKGEPKGSRGTEESSAAKFRGEGSGGLPEGEG